jgi:hypothetical protein
MVRALLWLLVLLRLFVAVTASEPSLTLEKKDSESGGVRTLSEWNDEAEPEDSLNSGNSDVPNLLQLSPQIPSFTVLQLLDEALEWKDSDCTDTASSPTPAGKGELKPRNRLRRNSNSDRLHSGLAKFGANLLCIASPPPKKPNSDDQLSKFTIVAAEETDFSASTSIPEQIGPFFRKDDELDAFTPVQYPPPTYNFEPHPHSHKNLHVHMGDINVAGPESREDEAICASESSSRVEGSSDTDLRTLIFVAAKHGSVESFRLHWAQYTALFKNFQHDGNGEHTLLLDAIIGDSPTIIKLILRSMGFDTLANADPAVLSEDEGEDEDEDGSYSNGEESSVGSKTCAKDTQNDLHNDPQDINAQPRTPPVRHISSKSYSNEYCFDDSDSESESDENTSTFGKTYEMLTLAAEHNALRIVEWLVKRHKVMDVPPSTGTPSALSTAVRSRHPLMVKYLLKHAGSQVNRVEPSRNRNVLLEAIASLYPDEEACAESLDKPQHLRKCALATVALLVGNKGSINVTNFLLESPLHIAVAMGDISLVEELFKAENSQVRDALRFSNRQGKTAFETISSLSLENHVQKSLQYLFTAKIAELDASL